MSEKDESDLRFLRWLERVAPATVKGWRQVYSDEKRKQKHEAYADAGGFQRQG